MEKVKITQEQADAIERCRVCNCDRDVMAIAISIDRYKNYEEMQYLAFGDFELFLSAMSNGYSVEETPEDKFKEYIKTIPSTHLETAIKVIDIFNIKIEGIN